MDSTLEWGLHHFVLDNRSRLFSIIELYDIIYSCNAGNRVCYMMACGCDSIFQAFFKGITYLNYFSISTTINLLWSISYKYIFARTPVSIKCMVIYMHANIYSLYMMHTYAQTRLSQNLGSDVHVYTLAHVHINHLTNPV